MPDYRIEFPQVGECVEFLDLVSRNERDLGIARSHVRVDVCLVPAESAERAAAASVFAVLLQQVPDGSDERLLAMARCRGFQTGDTHPQGEVLTVNEFLERVQLVAQPEMPSGHPLAVLLFRAGEADFRRCYEELLDLGCGGLRLGVVQPAPANQELHYVLFVDPAPAAFWPPTTWDPAAVEGLRVVTCYRLRKAAECPLYVQWDCEHPVRNVDQLYDFTQPPCQSVFAVAGPPPQWIRLTKQQSEGIFTLPEQRLRLDLAKAQPAVELEPATRGHVLEYEFSVQREARATSVSLEALETQIAHHQQAIADLRRDYRVAHALRREKIYLAYVFEQDLAGADGRPPPLSVTFARFLDQPYGQLEQLKYGFYESQQPDGTRLGLHFVFDERPESHAQLLTSLADEVYVQRGHWRGWRLPLYVRRGDDVRPGLEDEKFAPLVRDLLWQNGHPQDQPVLLRSCPRRGAPGTAAGWEALYVPETVPLKGLSCFHFLNDRFSRPVLTFRAEVEKHLAEQLQDSQMRLTDRCQTLEQQLLNVVRERLRVTDDAWHVVDERITELDRKTAEYRGAVATAESAIQGFPKTWCDFVEHILEGDQRLHRTKLAALADYRAEQEKLVGLIADHEKALVNVRQEAEQDERSVQDRRRAYEDADHQVRLQLDDLRRRVDDFCQLHIGVQRELAQRLQEAEARLADVQRQRDEARTQLNQLQSRRGSLRSEHDQLQREANQIREETQRCEREERECATRRQQNTRDRETLTALQRRLAALRTELEAAETQNHNDRANLEQEQGGLEHRRRELDTQLARQTAELNRMRQQVADLERRQQQVQRELEALHGDQLRVQAAIDQIQGELGDRGAARQRLEDLAQALSQRDTELQQRRQELETRQQQLAAEQQRLKQEEDTQQQAEEQLQREHQQQMAVIRERLELLYQRRAALQKLGKYAEDLAQDLERKTSPGGPEGDVAELQVEVLGATPHNILEEIRKLLQ